MRSSIPSTGADEGSPCKTCPNHFAGINKELCLNSCKRLAAYRDGKDWRGKEVFIVPEGKDSVEGIGTPDVTVDLEVEEEGGEDLETEIDQDKLPEIVTHIAPETSWKKAMSKKQKPEKPIQDICIMDGCDRPVERRGCCLSCYQRWRRGTINHPSLGVFRKMEAPELQQAKLKKIGPCLFPGCEKTGSKRGLCDRHYKRWRNGLILHPLYGKFEKINKTKKQTRTVVGVGGTSEIATIGQPEVDREAMLTPRVININFKQYEYLFSKIRGEAARLSLPVSHVIMTMLGEAAAINESDDKNKQGGGQIL